MPNEEAQKYAEGLSRISNWAEISVYPKSFASFDYGKDQVYREATKQ